jgi:hypothetical protein
MKSAIDNLKDQWSKAGFAFSGSRYKHSIDIEKLFVETAKHARNDGRLFSAIITWAVEFGDLINVSRLKKFVTSETSAVMGCALDIAIMEGASKKLSPVLHKCIPQKKRELFFLGMNKWKVTQKKERTDSLSVFKKWGFFASGYTIKKDALMNRRWVLSKNINFCFRHLFGPNAKAEILSILYDKPKAYINQLSKLSGLSYPPIYNEVENMIKSGMVECEIMGRMKIISLPGKTIRFLKAHPF